MKNNILKSIFVTILLLLGASHTAWGDATFPAGTTIWIVSEYNGGTNCYVPGAKETNGNNDYWGSGIGTLSVELKSDWTCDAKTTIFKTNSTNWAEQKPVPTDNTYTLLYLDNTGKSAEWKQPYIIYFKKPSTWGGDNVYVHFYSDDWKEEGNGYSGKNATKNCGAMTSIGDGYYALVMTSAPEYKRICFTKDQQDDYNYFHNTKVAYASGLDYSSKKVLWVPNETTTPINSCSYYKEGTWKTYPEQGACNIHVQGRFKVRTAKGGSTWKYTGSNDGDWNTNSTNIKFEYEEATGYYKLNTYCSVEELSAQVSGTNYYFHFKEGNTEYGATGENVMPALESNKSDIQSGSYNFLFTNKCPEGDNVVLYLDWVNKKFWYAVDASSTYTVTIATNNANYGSVSHTEVANVASGTSISASGNSLTIGNTAVTATPATQTDQYTYSFTNWTAIPNDGKVTDDITVTANFSRAYRTYTITYNLNEGTWDGVAGASSYTYGTGLNPLPTNIQRTGYTFDGWYTTSNFSGNAVTSISDTQTGDITLYAKWTKDYSKDIYYYFDERVTGWNPTSEKPEPGIAMNNTKEYAFILRPAYNNTDNKFKIFNCNPKDDNKCLIANGDNIATEPLCKEITLTKEPPSGNDDWKNILMPATTSDYFVILYYPNTTINSSNNFLVAASYTLPNAKTYNVSFGVVGNTGGTLTAKSGSSTIESGALVSFATFTATPAVGYAVEGWYADAEGNTKIDAAGTNTTYSQAITKANNTVYVKFAKKYAIYFKPNDIAWENIYAYLFTASPWEDTKGVHPKQNRSEYGQMSKLNDSVYYYNLTQTADITHFAFNNNVGQADYGEFNGCEAVYRSDFHKDMPVFIAQRDPKIEKETNSTKYYNEGVLMKFNDTDPGYELGIRNQSTKEMPYYRFTAEKAGDYISTVNVELTKDVTYSFLVKNDKAYFFTPQSATTCTSSNSHFELFKWDNQIEVVIKPAVTGTYTFQLNLANGKVEIDVLYPTTSYRLVYVEKNDGTIEKFHPSHIIKKHSEATDDAPIFDTVSMHVRPKMLTWNEETNKYDTTANNNTCEVWLQEFKKKEDGNGMDWETIQTINTKTYLTTNGVYNFIIAQGTTKTSIDPVTIRPYTGRYYIRTDASDGGWANFKQFSNLCYYTDYSRVYRGFDYYYCHWAPKANIKYTIACDYSDCVSDTLAQEDHYPHSSYTDANGTLQHNANVRFMWNSFDNTLDRAYIAGAGDNLHLLSASGIYDTEGTEKTTVSLLDQENWVYRADVKAKTQARIRLRAMPYNGADTYSWFRGKEGEITNENNTEQLIEGKAGTQYTIRVIYDFKTDHLICAWVPDGNVILDTIVVNADLMLLRENHGEAAQLKFSTNGQLKDITVAYSVINITKAHLSDKDKTTLREKEIYWISFPYDVNLSDVFGCGKYGEHFIIQYYDGAARAEKGCWADSPTFWTYIENPTGVVLKKGLGYVLVLDSKKILEDQFKYNNASVNIYFPSSGPIDSIDAKLPTAVEVPEHKCTIKRDNRDIYDSNWNIIGVPTWANIDKVNNPMKPAQSGDSKVGFYYKHDASNDTWSVCNEQSINFQSMYSYLVQWAGTINWQEWQEKSATGELHPSSLAPRRYAPAAEGDGEATAPEQYTLCLTLNRGETQLDHTYVRLQEGNVTTDFDLNYDMTKILNSGANLYSLVGTNLIQCAANVQPLQEEARTISIPLGVVADQDGLYTFSLPEGTEGMNVSIADYESGTLHNLSLGDYQTALTKGTYEGRFALEIQPRQEVTTGCEQTDAAGKSLRKVLIDGNLYILRDGKAYTAAGQEL